MKIEIKYFTGTGNSLKIVNTCKKVFTEGNHSVNISEIKKGEQISYNTDITGFCFPVYAFGIPRICRNYLKNLKRFGKTHDVFVIITAGDKDESGFSVNECVRLLKKKNCRVIYSAVIEMPANWTTFMNPPGLDEAGVIIERGVEKATDISRDILKNNSTYHRFNYPKRYSRFGLYKEYLLFRFLGIKNMWRCFKVYDVCNGCGLCARICPTSSIKMVNKTPKWSSTCEQCMRCVNFCPSEAIYQIMGGDTKGRNRYHEPDFKLK